MSFFSQKNQYSSYQQHWLSKFKWLVYSAVKNKSFFKYCVLFAPKSVGESFLGLHEEKAFFGAQCYANGRRYLCKQAKKY